MNLILQIFQTINNFFPDLFDYMREIEDHRRKPDYDIAEIITACIAMFLFKEGSRNAFNNDIAEGNFEKNYKKIFKMHLPHMDTVDRVIRVLEEKGGLEQLKTKMVKVLLLKKTLHKFRLFKRYFNFTIDGTGLVSFPERHCEHCLTKTSKSGKITYSHHVLEAKIVCTNGFSISVATEWIENPDGDFDKQDCEQKAFKRLAETIKKMYPRLPICVTADGLYPNKTFFAICKANNWNYIVTFKDGSLPSVWKVVHAVYDITSNNDCSENFTENGKNIDRYYVWLPGIDYHGHKLTWFFCHEMITKLTEEEEEIKNQQFTWLTDLKVRKDNVKELAQAARLRWKIENEGFNTQKNLGYNLQHKYSRVSCLAMKNYYQCLQIAHLINQLVELSSKCKELTQGKVTIKHLWKCMLGFMVNGILNSKKISELSQQRIQVRFG
ncbi:MAG: hypothetical protein U9N54_04795 [candidate division Zixibacteria bacterium]|nr:hypothetical protein [candidate division Zixibacteria bacterium]